MVLKVLLKALAIIRILRRILNKHAHKYPRFFMNLSEKPFFTRNECTDVMELVVLDAGFCMFGQRCRPDVCPGMCCCVCAGSGELSSSQTTGQRSQEDPAGVCEKLICTS